MHFPLLAAAALTGLFLLSPQPVEAACCDQAAHAKTACCDHTVHAKTAEPGAIEILLAMDPQMNPAPPVKQAIDVWFQRPVIVGDTILQGHYLIEHDNERMARGEPCTHIYAFRDRRSPVATFHCTHLERERSAKNVVVVVNTSDASMQKLTEFQFTGESFAHGYPAAR